MSDGGKSKGKKSGGDGRQHVRCRDCGRIGHVSGDPSCPEVSGARHSAPRKGGRTTTGPRKGGKWFGYAVVMTGLLTAMVSPFVTLPVEAKDEAYPVIKSSEAFIGDKGTIKTMIETGANGCVAGMKWLQRVEMNLESKGLTMKWDPCEEILNGLGGGVTAKWKASFPVGIGKSHDTVEYYCLEDEQSQNLTGLLSHEKLVEWRATINLGEGAIDMAALDVYGIPYDIVNGHMMLKLDDFDEKAMEHCPILQPFWKDKKEAFIATPAKSAIEGDFDEDREWFRDRVERGRRGTLLGAMRKQASKTFEKFVHDVQRVQDNGRTLLWEFSDNETAVTESAQRLGGVVCQPVYLDPAKCVTPKEQAKLLDLLHAVSPAILYINLGGMTVNYATSTIGVKPSLADKIRATVHLEFVMQLIHVQNELGGDFVCEIPARVHPAVTKWITRTMEKQGVAKVEAIGEPRRWKFLQTKVDYFYLVPDGSHVHRELQQVEYTKDEKGAPSENFLRAVFEGSALRHVLDNEYLADYIMDLMTKGTDERRPSAISREAIQYLATELSLRPSIAAAVEVPGFVKGQGFVKAHERHMRITMDEHGSVVAYAEKWSQDERCDPVLRQGERTLVVIIHGDDDSLRERAAWPAERRRRRKHRVGEYDRDELDEFVNSLMEDPDVRGSEDQISRVLEENQKAVLEEAPPSRKRAGDQQPVADLREYGDDPRPAKRAKEGSEDFMDDFELEPVEKEPADLHNFGKPPAACPRGIWEIIVQLHLKLGHCSQSSLQRVLKRMGADARVLEWARALKCDVCAQVKPFENVRIAALPRHTHINQNQYSDEFQVVTHDGTYYMLLAMMDDASSYMVAVPTSMTSSRGSVSAEEFIQLQETNWINRAGPPCRDHDL